MELGPMILFQGPQSTLDPPTLIFIWVALPFDISKADLNDSNKLTRFHPPYGFPL